MIYEKNKGEYASPSISKINSTCSGPQLRIVSTMSAGYDHIGNKITVKIQNKTLPKALRTQVLTALTSKFGLVGLVWWIWFGRFGLVGLIWYIW